MDAIFHAAMGIAELQDAVEASQQHDAAVKAKDDAKAAATLTAKDQNYVQAAKDLRIAVDANPTDFSVVYPLALAYLGQTAPDYQNGIWFAARAAAVAPAAAQAQLEKYATSQYVKFHAETMAGRKCWRRQRRTVRRFRSSRRRRRPNRRTMVLRRHAGGQDGLREWEFVFTNGAQADQDRSGTRSRARRCR